MSLDFEMDDIELKRFALELEQIQNEIQELEQTGKTIILSDNLENNMIQMIHDFELNDKKKKKQTSEKKIVRFIAVLMICVTVSLGVLTVNVDAFRIKLFDFIGKDHGEYMDVNIVEKGEISPEIKEKFPKEWDSVFYPMELPKGYKFVDADKAGIMIDLYFEKENKYMNLAYKKSDNSNILINSEDGEIGKTKINKKEAMYSLNNNNIILLWVDNGYLFQLVAQDISVQQAVNMAESIVYINLNKN